MKKKMRCEPYTFFCIRLHPLPQKCMPPGCRIKTYASRMMLVGVSLLQVLDCLACNSSLRAHDEEMSVQRKEADSIHIYIHMEITGQT